MPRMIFFFGARGVWTHDLLKNNANPTSNHWAIVPWVIFSPWDTMTPEIFFYLITNTLHPISSEHVSSNNGAIKPYSIQRKKQTHVLVFFLSTYFIQKTSRTIQSLSPIQFLQDSSLCWIILSCSHINWNYFYYKQYQFCPRKKWQCEWWKIYQFPWGFF
jgi:hypothetical protein